VVGKFCLGGEDSTVDRPRPALFGALAVRREVVIGMPGVASFGVGVEDKGSCAPLELGGVTVRSSSSTLRVESECADTRSSASLLAAEDDPSDDPPSLILPIILLSRDVGAVLKFVPEKLVAALSTLTNEEEPEPLVSRPVISDDAEALDSTAN